MRNDDVGQAELGSRLRRRFDFLIYDWARDSIPLTMPTGFWETWVTVPDGVGLTFGPAVEAPVFQ
jgi:hypothetical protein